MIQAWGCLALSTSMALSLTGCKTLEAVSIPKPAFLSSIQVTKEKPFIFSQSNRALGWGYLSHPLLFKNVDGSLQAGWNMRGDPPGGLVLKDIEHIPPAVSRDGGKTWAYGQSAVPPFEKEVRSLGYGSLWGTIPSTNGLIRFQPDFLPIRGSGLYSGVAYLDKNANIVEHHRSICHAPGIKKIHLGARGVELSNGDLLVVGFTYPPKMWTEAYRNKHKKRNTYLFRSTDGGRTFNIQSIVATPKNALWGHEGPLEPAIIALSDTELLCVMRTGGGTKESIMRRQKVHHPMLQARSLDGGNTWTYKKIYTGVYPKLMKMSNGVLVMSYGRPGNNIALSHNGGKTWEREVTITPHDVFTTGYIETVEVSPGKLLAIYDTFDSPVQKFWLWEPDYANTVWGIFLDVSRR